MTSTVVIRFGQVMSFREVIGHQRLLSLVSRAIARDSLTPSVVLSGPEGVGKRLTAVAIAQALNCKDRRSSIVDRPSSIDDGRRTMDAGR